MAENAVVRARVSEQVKIQATEVLAGMGLTVSDAVRLMLVKVANEGALPFDLTPNAETIEALRKSERGEDLHHAKDIQDLFKQLRI